MKSTTRKITLLSILSAAALGASAPAHATGFRFHGGLGAWQGSFSQSDAAGHEVDLRTLASLGLEVAAGFGFGPVFVEYNFAWFIANHTLSFEMVDPAAASSPSHREGPYFSPIGLNAGVSIPVIPIEPYIGIERGNFGFSTGTTDFSGYAGKAGVNVLLTKEFGLRAEYRRTYLSYDDAGKLPTGTSAQFDVWFVGLVFGKF